ncbi:hypothetical protein ABZV77_06670 [Streptomyces sp. NPDC004732]|uniref:hypothetical protein n=1 Tax=Streptomyces sp. NPDC004732 TaxID=3154290 RepID=UPI0033B67C41
MTLPTTFLPAAGHRVAAAIDFGTYASGYAWVPVNARGVPRTKEIVDHRGWPSARDPLYPKNLTALLLDEQDEVVEWGYLARERVDDPGTRLLLGMKMSLRPRRTHQEVDAARTVLDHVEDSLTDPVPLIAAYLKKLREVALAEITRYHYRPEDVRWCMTVPAIWSPKALAAMRNAAERAGFAADHDNLLLLPEPDAAAFACHIEKAAADSPFRELLRSFRRPERRFLVVDCGGGTIDVVSYRVAHDGTLEQLRAPSGGPYGAEYVTRLFVNDILADRLGGIIQVNRLATGHRKEVEAVMLSWERARNTFKGPGDTAALVELDSVHHFLTSEQRSRLRRAQGGDDLSIVITPQEMTALLDAAIEPLLACIDPHLAAVRQGREKDKPLLYVVGGFSKSPYLLGRVASHVGARAVVHQPERPERAVLHGAVHHCYAPAVSARRAPATYGVRVAEPYEPRDGERFWKSSEERYFCPDRFLKLATLDELLPLGTVRTHRGLVPTDPQSKNIDVKIYETSLLDPYYYDEGPHHLLGTVPVDLSACMDVGVMDRRMDLQLIFGDTEIRVRAVNVRTQEVSERVMEFKGAY